MMGGRIGWTGAVLAATALTFGGGALSAQQSDRDDTKGEALEQEAEALRGTMTEWKRAASLYREAGGVRDVSDPKAVDNYMEAARLSYYRGNEGQAVRDFESAGDRALMTGDIVRAAKAFADAAWVAADAGDGAKALAFHERAELLSLSPLLSREDRGAIKERLASMEGGERP